jgi:tetratricopeptide (TPR) repeat protein
MPVELLASHIARVGGALIRIAPQLQRRFPDGPPPTHTDSATERQLLFEAVGDILQAVATVHPTVVVLEDLHWAEPTTLRLVRHLIPHLGSTPVMFVTTHRDGENELTPEVRATIADLARSDATRARRIEGLTADELSALAADLVGAPREWDAGEFVAQLELATAGNPLFASQLVRHLAESDRLRVGADGIEYESTDDVPQDLRDIVWRRVSLLGDNAVEILATASALGVEFDVEVLGDMVDVAEDAFTAVINGAAGARLLNEGSSPRTLRFTHAVVAQALYGELRGVDRSRVHERAARVLAKSTGQHPQRIMVQLARHWALAGNDSEALAWAVAAGDGAMNQLAPAEAARWYAAAVDHARALGVDDSTLADLTIKLGDSQRRAGQPATRITLLQAAELAQRAGGPDLLIRAALLNTRGFQSGVTSDADRIDVIEAALAVVEPDNESERAQLLALLGQELNNTPDVARRRDAANRAIAIARASSDPALLARIAPAALYALWEPGSTAARTQLAKDAITRADLCGDPLLEFRIHTAAYTAAVEAADAATARRCLRKLQQLVRRLGEPGPRWVLTLYEVFEATVTGDLAVAETLNNANLELGLELGEDDAFNMFAGQFYQCRSFAWRLEELFPIVEQAATDSLNVPFQIAYGILCTRFGRVDEAQRILADGSRGDFANVPRDLLWTTSMVGYAILANELNDATTAPQIIESLEPFVALNAFNGLTSQGCIAAAVGRMLSVIGDYKDAEDHLLAALDLHTAFGWHYYRATGFAALAQNRRRWKGELDSFALECVAEAEAIARPRGLEGALEQIRWATDRTHA